MTIASGDVIAAVATAWGEAAIAIVRASGSGSVALANGFFRGVRPLAEEPARRMALGNIVDDDIIIDQVLIVHFSHGASYTGEESVEVHCHGGTLAARKCLELFTKGGARIAEPGEFTKRAFLNGRIDLAQAEAVAGVIRARSDAELISSGRSLQGEMSSLLRGLSDELTGLRSSMEARIDFPDDVEGGEALEFARSADDIKGKIHSLRERGRIGLTLRNGVRAALAGRPNVGKSSLMNAMLGASRSIVTDIPGTTRDTLEGALIHKGLCVTLVDTAGIRDVGDGDVIEGIGVGRSREAVLGADICVLVVDASERLTEDDAKAAEAARGKRVLLAANKSDLPSGTRPAELEKLGPFDWSVNVSATTGDGVEDLKDAIFEAAVGCASCEGGMLATERMIAALSDAAECVGEAAGALRSSIGIDVAGSLLAEASELLCAPLGADASEELLDAIFSNFCIGK